MVTRLSGMISGMDTDSIVANLMKAKRASVDKLIQNKQVLQWQRDSYRELNSKLLDFRNNKLFNFNLASTLSSTKAALTGNTSAISASAKSGATIGSIKVEVTSLATTASNVGITNIRTDESFDSKASLASQQDKISNSFTESEPGILDDLVFNLNGTEVRVDPNVDSLDAVIARINSTTNVNAFYDTISGKVSFTSKETGEVNGMYGDQGEIYIEDVSGSFIRDTFQVDSDNDVSGVNAIIKVNGIETTRTSNTFNINGVAITLLQPSGVSSPTTINVTSDSDAIVDKIKTFITDYNDLLNTLQTKVNEQRDREFPPLTKEQKKDMSDKDIEAWEAKAKSGLLKYDSILSKAVSNMRLSIMAQVDTGDVNYSTLSAIGITTGGYTDKGKLYLSSEVKLRAAIENNPVAVGKLFNATGVKGDQSDRGITQRMYTDLFNTLGEISTKAGTSKFGETTILNETSSTMGMNLTYLTKRINLENDRMDALEERYYKQFTAMEKALSKYNAQSTNLTNALNGG